MKIKKYGILWGVMLCMVGTVSLAYARLDIGSEIKIQSNYYNNLDYDPSHHDIQSYMLQRTRLYVEGEIQRNIIARVQLQSFGIWGAEMYGSTFTYYNQQYPNMTPWFEHAYLRMNDILTDTFLHSLTMNITVGKQSLSYGDGFVIDDNDHGVWAWKIQTSLPLRCALDLFDATMVDTNTVHVGKKTAKVTGAVLTLPTYKGCVPAVYYIMENDPTRTHITDGESSKIFYGTRLEGSTKEKLFYKVEYIKQGGSVEKDNSAQNYDYDGSAYMIGLSAKSVAPLFLGDTIVRFEYVNGTGGSDVTKKDNQQYLTKEAFSPLFARTVPGEGKSYYGEIFTQLHPGISNKQIGFLGIDANPYKTVHAGMNYFYLKLNNTGKRYGDEVDTYVTFTYAESVNVRLLYAYLMPHTDCEDLPLNQQKAEPQCVKLEVVYKF